MTKRVVDDLEAIKVQEKDSEFIRLSGRILRGTLLFDQLIERRGEYTAVRQAGQRIFGRHPDHARFRLATLCDVGNRVHEAAIREVAAAHLNDCAVWHAMLAN